MATATSTTPDTQLMSGADILVKSLVDHEVDVLFAYPGGASMPLHQSLTKYADKLRTILPRHEQGGAFAAQGYARSTGKPGVCMATSGPGATNLVTAIADAKLDSVPLVVITGQVPTPVIGSDAFQETPIVEVCRGITKHHYLVTDIKDLARVMKEAFFVATTGRPGPVLVDMPKNIQQQMHAPDFDEPMNLPGYNGKLRMARPEQIKQVVAAIKLAKRPVIYAGGGIICAGAAEELRELDEKGGGEGTPVGLDEVQVARRDAETIGELGLGQALASPQDSDLGSEFRLFGRFHHVSRPFRAPSAFRRGTAFTDVYNLTSRTLQRATTPSKGATNVLQAVRAGTLRRRPPTPLRCRRRRRARLQPEAPERPPAP